MEKLALVWLLAIGMLLVEAADLPLDGCYHPERWSVERGARVEASAEGVIFHGPGKALLKYGDMPNDTAFEGITFRIKGDGGTHRVILGIQGGAFRFVFMLTGDGWQEMRLAWSDFVNYTRDRALRLAPAMNAQAVYPLQLGDDWSLCHANAPIQPYQVTISDLRLLEKATPTDPMKFVPMKTLDEVRRKMADGERTLIYCDGDSITAGTGVGENRYANFLQEMLRKHYRNPQIEVRTIAVGGATSTDLRGWARSDLLETETPDLVTVMVGYNDNYAGIPYVDYKASIAELLERINSYTQGAATILFTPTPDELERYVLLNEYSQAIRELAAENHLPCFDLNALFEDKIGRENFPKYYGDRAHPNVKGHQRIAKELFQMLTGSKARTPKAMVILLDGARSDILYNLNLPNLRRLAEGRWQEGYQGLYLENIQTAHGVEASSIGNHSSMVTGVSGNKHRCRAWADSNHFWEYPTFFADFQKRFPEGKVLAAYSWEAYSWFTKGADIERFRTNPNNDPAMFSDENEWKMDEAVFARAVEFVREPDATLAWLDIDSVDHSGHGYGWFPTSTEQRMILEKIDAHIGEILDAIAARPTFDEEDWLIIVNSDHGGYAKTHGLPGGHCQTPLAIISSHAIEAGVRGTGFPNNEDYVPTILRHFGVEFPPERYDGSAMGKALPSLTADALGEALALYWPCEKGQPAVGECQPEFIGGNYAFLDENAGRFGAGVRFAKCDAHGAVQLVGTGSLSGPISFCCWVKPMPEMAAPEALVRWERAPNDVTTLNVPVAYTVLLDNANTTEQTFGRGLCLGMQRIQSIAQQAGFSLTTVRKTIGTWSGLHIDLLDAPFVELGPYDPLPGQWCFLAFAIDAAGNLLYYYGTPDGMLYQIAAQCHSCELWQTGNDLVLGGIRDLWARVAFLGDVDEVAVWNRALSSEEVRRIFQAGQSGKPLGELL